MLTRIANTPTLRRWTGLVLHPATQRITVRELYLLYGVWIVAFWFKLIGSSWDVAWHFRYLRDDLAPPHIINTFGMFIAVALLMFQSVNGLGAERRGLRIVQFGVGIFVIAIPLDLINHRLFGLDLTSWSPTHMLLFAGTAVMIIGILRSWLVLAPPGWVRTLFAIAFWAYLLEDILFALGQQEYGTLALDAYLKGRSTASSDLLALAGNNVTRFALGAIPYWLYPAWLIVGSTVVLVAARRLHQERWIVTSIAAVYLMYRTLAYTVLKTANFPPTFIPFMLLGGAVMIDLSARWRLNAVLASIAIVGVFYGLAELIGSLTLMPRFPLYAAPFIPVVVWGVYQFTPQLQRRWSRPIPT